MGTETGASWKDQEKYQEPNLESPKKARERGSPVVRSRVAEAVAVACGNTKTEALVYTRNLRPQRESSRGH